MAINNYGMSLDTEPEVEIEEIPAWKELDEAVRKWVVLSGFEKDQENYQKLKDSL